MSEENLDPTPKEGTPIGGIGAGAPDPKGAAAPEPLDFSSEKTYQEFRASLPEELRDKEMFATTKSLTALAEQAINAQSALGKKRLPVPQEDWQDTDWEDFYSQLRPETIDGYKGLEKHNIELEGKDAKEYSFEPETASQLKDIAHSMGLTPKQYQQLEAAYAKNAVVSEGVLSSKIDTHVQELTNELRKEWGNDFALNHKSANEAYQALASQIPELTELMEWSPIVANHPAVMKLFHTLAPLVKDVGMSNTGNASGFGNDTVAGLKSQIQDFNRENHDMLVANPDKIALMTPADRAKRERLLHQRTDMYKKLYASDG